jgi:hypothetical protein
MSCFKEVRVAALCDGWRADELERRATNENEQRGREKRRKGEMGHFVPLTAE